MVQALDGLVAGYQKAIKANKGQWPTTEQVADAMRGLEFRGLTGTVKIREDGQGLEDQLLGVTRKVAGYNFPVLEKITIYPADLISTPVGQKSPEWVKTVKPELIKNPRFKQLN
jgi:branched-chain amino acid transport system substrate-binding protein